MRKGDKKKLRSGLQSRTLARISDAWSCRICKLVVTEQKWEHHMGMLGSLVVNGTVCRELKRLHDSKSLANAAWSSCSRFIHLPDSPHFFDDI